MPLEGEQLGFLEKVIKLEAKYGLFKIFKALIIIALFVYVMYNAQNLDHLVHGIVTDAITEQSETAQLQHDASIQHRYDIKGQMDSDLKCLLQESRADRVFVLEMHNGTNNPSGLSFLSASMTYEQTREGVTHIDDDYSDVLLSRFDFPMKLKPMHVWCGTIDQLAAIDEKLAYRMKSNDVTYMAIIEIYGVKTEIGYLGITYCGTEPLPEKEIRSLLAVYCQKVSTLLDINTLVASDETPSDNQ